jgi:predicted transglutaminase-like cysteine proteinase
MILLLVPYLSTTLWAKDSLKISDSMPSVGSYTAPIRTVKSPPGWQQFCTISAADCEVKSLFAALIKLDSKAWHDINVVNRHVNQTIEQISDLEHYGVIDWWAYPDDGKGDCEDLQLLKRKLLIQAGYPRTALLMTVVRDEAGEGHAVLIVRTDRGDLVLDNKTDQVKNWQATAYEFYKRQSQENPNQWVAIGEGADTADIVVSGLH